MQKNISKIVFSAPRHCTDMRLDAALFVLIKEKYPENAAISRGFITRLIKAGRVTLNKAITKPSTLVSLHDEITLSDENVLSSEKVSLNMNTGLTVEVIFENEHILVINKTGDMQMHPAGRHTDDTVANWLITQYPKLKNVGENILRPGIVHRLDRETSGVLVIAKTQESFAQLKKLFQDRYIEKTYVALVYGNIANTSGVIDKPLIQKSGELKRRVIEQTEKTKSTLSGDVRNAVTEYHVIARYKGFDLVLASPKTGRTHQIRAHFASIGHPVVGDKLYTFKTMREGKMLFPSRHMLHAWRLKLSLFKQNYSFEAPLPLDFQQSLRGVDETELASYDDEALKSLFLK